ncbi:thermonuclease family protein [Myxococcus stipitatus]|uniref:thermonuclease family protein n=1 Tax=Myxococcus stipitatus TaxID=83455 RepID=UPI001F2E4A68|nr:thermonuclease family protein [Myxococcus stipitatus]MCE9669064.1 thermonuclease family protein [Myxococcus stipitatus]
MLALNGGWLAGLMLLCAACGDGAEGVCGPSSGRVVEVVDGDTLVLEGGARVRYLLVDTPETTGGHADCYGAEARAFNRRLVEGRAVTLVDGEACEDRFGRRLAYVRVDGQEVNTLLVERGLACVLHVPPAGSARKAEFQALEARARAARHGMWGACSPVPCAR